jgi:hypothetical protein
MDHLDDVVLAMFGVAIAAVLLVAGAIYLAMRPDPPDLNFRSSAVVTARLNSGVDKEAQMDASLTSLQPG